MKYKSEQPFIYSHKYRILRHFLFWAVHIIVFTFVFWTSTGNKSSHLLISTLWALLFIIYAYPVMYWIIPGFLLKQKYYGFTGLMLAWATMGWFWNFICRKYLYYPLASILHFKSGTENLWAPASYLGMNLMMGFGSMIILFKYSMRKQREYLVSQKDKIAAELQLLKAQIHPHFLFNTLNNIYAFSMQGSAKAPVMITHLSSLLSYMIYDCKHPEVLLEKEIEVMRNYIDLEKERYGNTLEVSVNIEGDISGKYIAPLILLPFIENSFKHGTSQQLDKPWISMDISVTGNNFYCKILNSKDNIHVPRLNGIGVKNVQRRLKYLYDEKHQLKLTDEGDFFVVAFSIDLSSSLTPTVPDEKNLLKRFENFTL